MISVSGFDRPNIRYSVAPKDRERHQLLAFLEREHPRDSGIVYCLSRRRTEQIAAWLGDHGFTALPYHAGLDADVWRAARNLPQVAVAPTTEFNAYTVLRQKRLVLTRAAFDQLRQAGQAKA